MAIKSLIKSDSYRRSTITNMIKVTSYTSSGSQTAFDYILIAGGGGGGSVAAGSAGGI